MSLAPREKQALRQIERQLSTEDPALGVYLSGRVRKRYARSQLLSFYALPPVLLGLGVLLHLAVLLLTGVVLAPVAPALGWWMLCSARPSRPAGHGRLAVRRRRRSVLRRGGTRS